MNRKVPLHSADDIRHEQTRQNVRCRAWITPSSEPGIEDSVSPGTSPSISTSAIASPPADDRGGRDGYRMQFFRFLRSPTPYRQILAASKAGRTHSRHQVSGLHHALERQDCRYAPAWPRRVSSTWMPRSLARAGGRDHAHGLAVNPAKPPPEPFPEATGRRYRAAGSERCRRAPTQPCRRTPRCRRHGGSASPRPQQ